MKEKKLPASGIANKQFMNVLKRKRKHLKDSNKKSSVTGLQKEILSNKGTNMEMEDTSLSSNIIEDNLPLSMFLKKAIILSGHVHQTFNKQTPVSFDDQDEYDSEKENEIQPQSTAITEKINSIPKQDDKKILHTFQGNWLFTKSLPIWEALESNQIFKLMPQHPHFRPLEQYNEEIREGKAIGNMFNFIHLVERTSNAKLHEHRSIFENRLKVLANLEEHGFIVQPIKIQLQEILRRKSNHSELDDEQKVTERELGKGKQNLDDINMKLQRLLKDKEEESTTLAKHERELAKIKQFQNVELDFHNMMASPLVSTNCE